MNPGAARYRFDIATYISLKKKIKFLPGHSGLLLHIRYIDDAIILGSGEGEIVATRNFVFS